MAFVSFRASPPRIVKIDIVFNIDKIKFWSFLFITISITFKIYVCFTHCQKKLNITNVLLILDVSLTVMPYCRRFSRSNIFSFYTSKCNSQYYSNLFSTHVPLVSKLQFRKFQKFSYCVEIVFNFKCCF